MCCLASCEPGEYLESDTIDDESADLDSSGRDGAVGPSVNYQAESYTAQSGCGLATNHAGYTGNGFMDYGGNASYIEWNNVNAAAAGSYQLTFRYANGSGGARQAAILINGISVGNVAFAPTGGWPQWGTATIESALRPGKNTIRVLANTGSGGPNLDSLEVTPVDLCPSDPNKTTPGICGCGKPEDSCTIGANGLKGTYFDNVDFTGLKLERVDSSLDFNWGKGSPESRIGSDTFSVQWAGFVEAKFSESYTFYAVSDDGIRVSLDDQLVIDDWSIHAPREQSGTISLVAGRRYKIKVEYFENGGGAVARLLWSSASQAKQVIPKEQLFTEPQSGENHLCVEIKEASSATLSCPSGSPIISIDFASYGLPTGSCPNGFTSGTCHAASSLDKVKSLCLNQLSCSVAASNSVFGDPCSGKPKKLAVTYACSGDDGPDDQMVKVFILAGQSNMVGQGTVAPNQGHLDKNGGMGTLEYLVDDPKKSATYSHLVTQSGQWTKRDDVWLVDLDSAGPLTMTKDTFGPELQFGHVVGDFYDNPVLIIKTSWGGKSLAVDFRPPSSGGEVGPYYTAMVDQVYSVLDNIKKYVPGYNEQGYELAGFGWHQGWNDRINQAFNDAYQTNCVNLINDLRDEFGVPDMPFVLATTGMNGWQDTHPRALSLMEAQLAVPNDPRLKNRVNAYAVETRDFWRDQSVSPADQGYHWNRNAETYFLIGDSMGKAMVEMVP